MIIFNDMQYKKATNGQINIVLKFIGIMHCYIKDIFIFDRINIL
jgi:hypothetical protein